MTSPIRFILTLSLLASAAFSQGTDLGTIRGTVTDPTGSVIAGAAVEVVDLGTNQSRKVTTNSAGVYEAGALRSGQYKVVVSMAGFATTELTGLTVRGGDVANGNAQLSVNTATQTVLVEETASAVQTDSPVLATSLDNKVLIEIPRDSRDIYQFLYLNPNITQSANGTGSFKFLGAQSYGASFSLDGQRSNGGIFGEPTGSQPSLEVIGELNVLSNSFSAEYAGIANIRVTTKRGGKDYHGSLFYNNRNSALSAWALRDKFELARFTPSPERPDFKKPYFNLNEFGGSFGGPAKITSKTYFMLALERRLGASPIAATSTTLPHPTLWTGNFTRMNDSAKPLVPAAVTLTAAEVASNTVGGLGQRFTTIPSRLLNPVTQAIIQKYFPKVGVDAAINAANGRLSRFYQSLPTHANRTLGTARLDHDFSEKNRVYGVFNVLDGGSDSSLVQSPFTGLGNTQTEQRNYTLSLSYTRIVSPSVINEVRGGFNQQNLFRHSNTTLRGFLSSIGFNDADIAAYGASVGLDTLDTFGHPRIQWGNYAVFNNGGRNTYRPLDQRLITFGDTMSWILGKHSFRAGADFVRNAATDGFANNRGQVRGAINYTGNAVDAFTRFLLGLPANTAQSVIALRPPMKVHNWETGFFVQDDWKVNSRLTVNLGLRYEVITPFVEENDLMVNFDADAKGLNGKQGIFIVPSERTVKSVDPRILNYGYILAKDAGVGRGLVRTDTNNFAPRVGAAYRIANKSVLRGGYGIFYPTSAAQGMRDALATNPFNQTVSRTNNAAAPLQPWPGATHGISPVSGGMRGSTGNLPAFNIIPLGLISPRIQQYNVTFEHELLSRMTIRASYLGTRMNNMIAGVDRNMIAPSDTPFGTTTGDGVTPCTPDDFDCDYSAADTRRLPFPGLGDYMASYQNLGNGRSHAFQTELNRRAANFTFNIAYTYLDQQTAVLDSGNSTLGGPTYNQFNPGQDFGWDSFVSRHRMVAYGLYDVPFGKGRKYGGNTRGITDAVLGGWQITSNMYAKSGTGFTPFWYCENCGPAFPGNIGSGFVDAYGGFDQSFRARVTGDTGRVGDQQWNPAGFTVPTVGADFFSNSQVAKRNQLIGPGSVGVNLGVHKVFRAGERVRADFGADINNLFNHPLLSPADNAIANLGSFAIEVDPATLKIKPIARVTPNPDFGRLTTSFAQDGIDLRRAVRLRLRVTF
ncbi:MAG: carboxypeptidase regulatory-like domain-containing protein [Acidobacteria bacterium]|nr:carboxypeptidase regulatory-like domain-containing protein [Acidobacteriota bacterium]